MQFLTKLTQRLYKASRLIEQPDLWRLRQRGGMVETFLEYRQPWLQQLKPATVLDIGANTGRFALTLHAAFPQAMIYSFEPLPDCFAELQQRIAGVPQIVGFNLGLGDSAGELAFQRSASTPSSSFLPMTDTHKQAYPFTRDSQSVMVKLTQLDQIASQLVIREPLLIKIDVQGYEGHVLRGGEQTIRRAAALVIETSFTTLYAGQPLFDEVYRQLQSWGFRYAGALYQHQHPQTGQILQADSVFLR